MKNIFYCIVLYCIVYNIMITNNFSTVKVIKLFIILTLSICLARELRSHSHGHHSSSHRGRRGCNPNTNC